MLFHYPTCSCNHPYNHRQQSLPLLQSTFDFMFHLPTCLPTNIPSAAQPFFTSVFLHTVILTIHDKNLFSYLVHWAISGCIKDQETNEQMNFVCTETVKISPCFPDLWTGITAVTDNHWYFIAQAHNIGILQIVTSEDVCDKNNKLSTPLIPIPSIYYHYFIILLIPSKDLTCSWKPVSNSNNFQQKFATLIYYWCPLPILDI